MKTRLFAVALIFVLVFAAFAQAAQAAQEAPTLDICEVSFWDEGTLRIEWAGAPLGGTLYTASYLGEDLTAGTAWVTATDTWYVQGSNVFMQTNFAPRLLDSHTYKISGVVCTVYFSGFHVSRNALINAYFLNVFQHLPAVIKSFFR